MVYWGEKVMRIRDKKSQNSLISLFFNHRQVTLASLGLLPHLENVIAKILSSYKFYEPYELKISQKKMLKRLKYLISKTSVQINID